jgi:hypothetical protein
MIIRERVERPFAFVFAWTIFIVMIFLSLAHVFASGLPVLSWAISSATQQRRWHLHLFHLLL